MSTPAAPPPVFTMPALASDGGADPDADAGELRPACVLVFNANDPLAAGGLGADVVTLGSMGVHALPVVTGAWVRDSSAIHDHIAFDEAAVEEQARAVLEDVAVQAFKLGFVGQVDNLGAAAREIGDYPGVPLVLHMPDLSWWDLRDIERYLDAATELVLPLTTVLTGSQGTLARWLLPDWSGDGLPGPRKIAQAAAAHGAAQVLVTGIARDGGGFLDNVLATSEAVRHQQTVEWIDARFAGAGDTLAASLAALLATGQDPAEAAAGALAYLDRALMAGFAPGMGHHLPDRMFWAQAAEDDDEDPTASRESNLSPIPP